MNHALEFREDGSFTIVQFTDLHWHDGTGLDVCTASLMEMVLDAERPDFVVLTGDVLEGSECPDPAVAWRQAVEPMERRSIPWAAVFGNHDDEGSLDRHQLMAVQRSCRMSLSEPGPSSLPGVGNYVLDVRSSRRSGIAASLYFLDSGSYAPDGNGYAAISSQQIEWFRESVRHRSNPNDGRPTDRAPLFLFLHIPLPEFELAWQSGVVRGLKLEDVQCPRSNTGFFAAVQTAGVRGVFAGHDHVNDFDADWNGARLCYGRATGYQTYGRDGFAHGARVIRLIEGQPRFETWLRLEDGSSVGQL